MVLPNIAFHVWLVNCLVMAVIARFTNWETGIAVVASIWVLLTLLGVVGDMFASRQSRLRLTGGERVGRAVRTLGYLLIGVVVALAWPVAYLIVAAQKRGTEWR